MTVVTLEEARNSLPELIQLMATGEKVVIADGEKWIAALAAPPPLPPTPEEIAAAQARAEEAVRAIQAMREAHTASVSGSTVQEIPEDQRQLS